MNKPLIAIPSFPGSNGEVDNLRVLKRCGFRCFVFRWNDSRERLKDVDGYFFGAGFSYEDRGRSGMVAARDPLFDFIREEAERGKVIVGNCNGAQVLIESGLIPLGDSLRMCLARNAIRQRDGSWRSPGFLNEWVWITPTCGRDRCAVSDWTGTLHIPIAHGEGRFVTQDKDLMQELEQNDQIAFRYSDAEGNVSIDPPYTPNGSTGGIAGICNPAGNVVALMPHPERTAAGDPYFVSMRKWIEKRNGTSRAFAQAMSDKKIPGLRSGHVHEVNGTSPKPIAQSHLLRAPLPVREAMPVELFIDTIITNNEERTVEQALRRVEPVLRLKQYRYVGLRDDRTKELLSKLSFFSPHKEIAYVRKAGKFLKWNSDRRRLEDVEWAVLRGIALLRRDEPDTAGRALGRGAETGICYDCRDVKEKVLTKAALLEVFCNPHASVLERLS